MLSTLLQMVEIDRKTRTLQVRSQGQVGPPLLQERRAARPHDWRDRLGVPPAHGPERESRGDGPDAPEARAHGKKKSLTATEQAQPRIQEFRRRFIAYVKTLGSGGLWHASTPRGRASGGLFTGCAFRSRITVWSCYPLPPATAALAAAALAGRGGPARLPDEASARGISVPPPHARRATAAAGSRPEVPWRVRAEL